MLTTLAVPAFAKTWYIEDGDITVKAGETEGTNKVSQGENPEVDDTDTIITNQNKDTASSNTVTIDAGKDKVEVTLKDVNIDASSRKEAAMSVTGSGNTTIKLDGDNHLTGGNGSSGIDSIGSLTIYGGENDSLTAKGGSGADGYGGDGIRSGGVVTISGNTVNAAGGYGGKVGGYGICSFDRVAISGGTVEAAGGNGSTGGDGISSSSGVTVSDGTVTATGGNSTGSYGSGGDGIRSDGGVTISGGTVKAAGGDSKDGYGGDGITSNGGVTISGSTVNTTGGNGNGGNGSRSDVGNGIISSVIDLSGSLELTAKAGSPNGKALSQNDNELDLDTIKEKLGPGAKVTATDANGETKQVSIPRPVEPEESSSSSDGGSATPSAPVSSLPGLTVTDKSGAVISYTSTQSGNTLTICVGRFTASLRASLSALRQLRAEGIETITFQTILCSTTLSVDELLAMGGEDAEAVLTHRSTDSSLTVG